jgi:hypothetical protein
MGVFDMLASRFSGIWKTNQKTEKREGLPTSALAKIHVKENNREASG